MIFKREKSGREIKERVKGRNKETRVKNENKIHEKSVDGKDCGEKLKKKS